MAFVIPRLKVNMIVPVIIGQYKLYWKLNGELFLQARFQISCLLLLVRLHDQSSSSDEVGGLLQVLQSLVDNELLYSKQSCFLTGISTVYQLIDI